MWRRLSRGFTAVEMLAVLTLMAILAASAALSLVDRLARQQARRTARPVVLMIDVVDGSVTRDGDAVLRVPEGMSLERVMTLGAAETPGPTEIPISASGFSPTYALLLRAGSQSQWLVVSSVGSFARFDDDGTIDNEFEEQSRHDAH